MTKVLRYNKEDVDSFVPRQDLCGWTTAKESIRQFSKESWVTMFTLHSNDGVIAIFGGYLINEKVAEIFCFTSQLVLRHYATFIRSLNEYIDFTADKLELSRIQCVVNSDIPEAEKYARSLGLNVEGKMLKYMANGGDAYMCAKVFQ